MSSSHAFDRSHTDDLMSFLSASPSPYHAVANTAARLEKAGFRQVEETAAWDATSGGKYVLRGGAIIGVLERLAVCLAILTGQPVAIAYVVAIKGLGRFAELKETPVAAERFIIGTLTSMLWAAGVAAVVKIFFLG